MGIPTISLWSVLPPLNHQTSSIAKPQFRSEVRMMGHFIHLQTVPPTRLFCLVQLAYALLLVSSLSNPSSVVAHAPPPVFGNTTDYSALLFFKSLIQDPSGALDSWNTTLHFCHWRGVTCGGRRHPQRVIALDLEGLNLVGTLSPSLANLTFLRRLHLPGNQLDGRILPEFGRLLRLRHLNLSSNSLVGEMPANLSYCANLRNLSISRNMITGEIPKQLSSLARLEVLHLSGNMITGQIPPSMGNLSSLLGFYLGRNGLEGSIPLELGSITGLQYFQVGHNMLSGIIPPTLYNISSLRQIYVSNNSLSGTLPQNLGCGLPQLRVLNFFKNQFVGHVPSSFPNASRLSYIDLSINNFFGVIPSNLGALQDLTQLTMGMNQLEAADWRFLRSLTNCSKLKTLGLQKNKLQGSLPTIVANLSTELQFLSFTVNNISGHIPPDIDRLTNLEKLYMGSNQLIGAIPNTVGKLRSLVELDLSNNHLSGEIPSFMSNLTRLAMLWLYTNDLEGRIPTSFRNYKFLEELDLSNNRLSGEIPIEVMGLKSLTLRLDLSVNSFIGSLPTEVGSLTYLLRLDISNNKLSGEIPISLGDCQMLWYLAMAGNSFRGSIPLSLSKLKGLKVMDLSRNQFSGPIPGFLQSFPDLYFLNLSFNDFEGEVPEGGVFQNYSAYMVMGNSKLCGGDPRLHLPTRCPARKHGPSKVAIIIPILIASFLCFVFLFLFLRRRQTLSSRKECPPFASLGDAQYTRISYWELLKATNGFSEENLLGRGSFGSVYKGTLDEGRKFIAIKVLNLQQHGAAKSFMTECEAMRNIRHRNLLKILTSCSSLDLQGNEFKALVSEFMVNGSLEKWLHPEQQYSIGLSSSLNFLQRLNIAIDVASALDYLHNHGQAPIIHCDLKPSNILLDCDMCAHVGDFGLSRFLFENGEDGSNMLTSSIGIKGSIGYIAPEYGIGSQPYTLGDVYSYGILLLEMFTGKRPTDELFQEGFSLHKYVDMAFPANVMDILDPCLVLHHRHARSNHGIQDVDNTPERLQECLVSIINVGLMSSKESPKERMEMGDVVKEMSKIRGIFF